MERALVLDELMATISDLTEVSSAELSEDTNFQELPNWDSIAYISVLTMIESEFGLLIDDHDFNQLSSIGSLTDFIQAHANPEPNARI